MLLRPPPPSARSSGGTRRPQLNRRLALPHSGSTLRVVSRIPDSSAPTPLLVPAAASPLPVNENGGL